MRAGGTEERPCRRITYALECSRYDVGWSEDSESRNSRLHLIAMGRPKGFTREDVLLKAISVFWEKGFSDTRLQDLEQATGVNKSGLYSEFKNKEDIFLESLRY